MSCTLDNGFGIWLLDQPVSNHERIEAKRCHSDLSPQPALTFMPSSFPLSINSSSLLLSSNWEENTGRVSLPPRPLWTHRGHATRSPRVDLHDIGPQGCPSPPSFPHCTSGVDSLPPGAPLDQERHKSGPRQNRVVTIFCLGHAVF